MMAASLSASKFHAHALQGRCATELLFLGEGAEMRSLDISDMNFVNFDVFSQYLINICLWSMCACAFFFAYSSQERSPKP
jgi:hypothetical protein